MSRVHLHVVVEDLDVNTRYYTALFGAEPTVVKEDYVKWILDDPHINFDISTRGRVQGLDHVGIQTESNEELVALQSRLESANFTGQTLTDTACCYEHSNKHWTMDPQGIVWETFYSLYPISTFNEGDSDSGKFGCCAPVIFRQTYDD